MWLLILVGVAVFTHEAKAGAAAAAATAAAAGANNRSKPTPTAAVTGVTTTAPILITRLPRITAIEVYQFTTTDTRYDPPLVQTCTVVNNGTGKDDSGISCVKHSDKKESK